MRCKYCNRLFKDGEHVVPVQEFIMGGSRGSFVANANIEYIHYDHLLAVM